MISNEDPRYSQCDSAVGTGDIIKYLSYKYFVKEFFLLCKLI